MQTHPWLLAIRPKTLTASVAPILLAGTLAISNSVFNFYLFISCLLAAIFLQIGSNLANDYFDFIKKADNEFRLGPVRVTQAGLISPDKVKMGFIISFCFAFISGIYPIWIGGTPILLLGLLCILFAIIYTGGPYPLAYLGLGEIFAFIFFGIIPTGFTYFIMSKVFTLESFIVGMFPGLFAIAMISINNLRDINTDRLAGKKTMAVIFGEKFARIETAFTLLFATCFPAILLITIYKRYWLFLMFFIPLMSIKVSKKLLTQPISKEFNNHLAFAARLNILSAITYSIIVLLELRNIL